MHKQNGCGKNSNTMDLFGWCHMSQGESEVQNKAKPKRTSRLRNAHVRISS